MAFTYKQAYSMTKVVYSDTSYFAYGGYIIERFGKKIAQSLKNVKFLLTKNYLLLNISFTRLDMF